MKKSYENHKHTIEFDDAGTPRLYWNEEGSRTRWVDVPQEIKGELLEMIENGEEDVEIEEIKANVPEVIPQEQTKEIIHTPETTLEKQVSELTMADIKHYICPLATDQEAHMFLKLCQARNLNPFTNEVYLIKYKEGMPASTVVGKDTFTRRAESNENFDGFEAGSILITESGEIERRNGACILPEEKLVGGWAKVHRKVRQYSFVSEVPFTEYAGTTYDRASGQKVLNSMWNQHGPTMIRKVALVQALREAFPGELGGLYDKSEMGD